MLSKEYRQLCGKGPTLAFEGLTMRPLCHYGRRGTTIVEVMICSVILLFVGLGTVASIIFTRQSMELDKQRLAALNYCRQAMEAAGAHATISSGSELLVPFNTPGTEDLFSTLELTYFNIIDTAPNTGKIDWGNPLDVAPQDKPVLCRAQVTWTPPGRFSRQQKVSMYTIVRAGTL